MNLTFKLVTRKQHHDAEKIMERHRLKLPVKRRARFELWRYNHDLTIAFSEHGGFTVCVLRHGPYVSVGASMCSRSDKYNPRVGQHIAFRRAVLQRCLRSIDMNTGTLQLELPPVDENPNSA